MRTSLHTHAGARLATIPTAKTPRFQGRLNADFSERLSARYRMGERWLGHRRPLVYRAERPAAVIDIVHNAISIGAVTSFVTVAVRAHASMFWRLGSSAHLVLRNLLGAPALPPHASSFGRVTWRRNQPADSGETHRRLMNHIERHSTTSTPAQRTVRDMATVARLDALIRELHRPTRRQVGWPLTVAPVPLHFAVLGRPSPSHSTADAPLRSVWTDKPVGIGRLHGAVAAPDAAWHRWTRSAFRTAPPQGAAPLSYQARSRVMLRTVTADHESWRALPRHGSEARHSSPDLLAPASLAWARPAKADVGSVSHSFAPSPSTLRFARPPTFDSSELVKTVRSLMERQTPPMQEAAPPRPPQIDIRGLTQHVYAEIEQALRIEKERRGR